MNITTVLEAVHEKCIELQSAGLSYFQPDLSSVVRDVADGLGIPKAKLVEASHDNPSAMRLAIALRQANVYFVAG